MININDTLMYIRYYKKVVFLNILKALKGHDYVGRIENSDRRLRGYEGCYPIRKVLKKLKITETDSILDIGCGKGLFIYYASKFKFNRIDGIEYSAELVEIAKHNSRIIGDNRVHIHHCDARTFKNYRDYNYFFINNPFDAEIMEQVLREIVQNHKEKTPITIIYQFPFNLTVFTKLGFKIKYMNFPNCILIL